MLEVDGLAFNVEDPSMDPTPSRQVQETDDWLLRSGYIDLISGLNESLLEGCRIIRLFRVATSSKEQPISTIELAEALMDKIDVELMRKNIPELLDELQREVGKRLPLLEAVTSINKVRNCLVHRNGIVDRRDVNIREEQVLRLNIMQHQIYVRADGVDQRLTRALKSQSPVISALKTENWEIHIDYPIGSPIILTTDIYNDSFYTCYAFLSNLRLQIYNAMNVVPTQAIQRIVLTGSTTSQNEKA